MSRAVSRLTSGQAVEKTRKPSIAVLKALGAQTRLVRDLHLIQIGALAAVGILIGLGVGALIPRSSRSPDAARRRRGAA